MAIFEFPIRVYWEDTDAGGIVFYANYLKFFERARTEWLRWLGIGQRALRERTGGMFVVSRVNLKYHRAARLDDQLVVTAELQRGGLAALELAQRAWLPDEAGARQLLCQANIRIGWVDAASMKPARMPPDIVEKLNT
jgi:acyl-CoA thioester hydrolase